MKPQPETFEAQILRELNYLEVGPNDERAAIWIHPTSVMHWQPRDVQHLWEILKEKLQDNDVYNGYVFVYNKDAAEYLNAWNEHRNCYNIDDAVSIAHEFGYTLGQIERTGFALLANLHANYTAELRDEERIQQAAERIFLILQTMKEAEPEEAEN